MESLLPFLVIALNLLIWIEGKDKVLESKRILDRGTWGPWDECPSGSYVMGFVLKVDPENGPRVDDTAINAISLICATLSAPMTATGNITSTQGEFGLYRNKFFCDNGFVNGFDLRVSASGDYWGATNLRVFCSNLGKGKPIEGDGLNDGEWGGPKMCKKFQAVCAMRTQVEPYRDNQDDTSLNNVDMRCCDVSGPAKTCKPTDKFVDMVTCDNLSGAIGSGSDYFLNCTYSQTVGVSQGTTASVSSFGESEATKSLGLTTGAGIFGLKLNLETNLEATSTTGGKWDEASTQTYSKETTHTAFFTVPPGSKIVLQQAMATCGSLVIGSSNFRKVDYKKPKTVVN